MFHVPSVSYLGFIIERGQLRADPKKICAVREWPPPFHENSSRVFCELLAVVLALEQWRH